MATLLYSATASLDGYIAGPGGDLSWMEPYLVPNPTVDALVEHVGALLVGARTFRGDDPYRGTEAEGKAFGGGWQGPQVVLTHHAPDGPVPDVTFVDDLARGIELASAFAGDRYVNVLGADLARQCLAAGALDEILVSVLPVLLGGGTRLLERADGAPVHLDRVKVADDPPATNLWFRVVR